MVSRGGSGSAGGGASLISAVVSTEGMGGVWRGVVSLVAMGTIC